jgi:halocin C8-like bacteriocin domain-containing protein
MFDLRRWRSSAAALVLVLVAPMAIAPAVGSASTTSAAPDAWERAAAKRPQESGTSAQRAQAKAVVAASAQAAGRAYAYDRAVVQVRDDKAVVQAVAPGEKQASSTVFIVDLAKSKVLTARTIKFVAQANDNIAITVSDGKKQRFHGTIDEKTGKMRAGAGYTNVLAHAQKSSGKCTSKSQTVQAAGICEWAVGALCGTAGGATCYGACIALGLVSGPGGLGCATVCALIASLGCAGATDAICS